MKGRRVSLELSLVSQPSHVSLIGDVDAVPAVGDFVSYDDGPHGYVKSRRWDILVGEPRVMVVRIWLQGDPP